MTGENDNDWYPGRLPPAVDAFVREHGVRQEGRPVPASWRRRRKRNPHGCYEAAGKWSGRDNAHYTEGHASSGSHLVPHAWLTGPQGEVIDLAWSQPGTIYVGVVIPDDIVSRLTRESGWFGPLLPTLVRSRWLPAGRPDH